MPALTMKCRDEGSVGLIRRLLGSGVKKNKCLLRLSNIPAHLALISEMILWGEFLTKKTIPIAQDGFLILGLGLG
jgi:hypothetical protein